jgi:hypothetical protein
MVATESHDIGLSAPWYAPTQTNVALHRYLDANFVASFQADVAQKPLANADLFAWQAADRMGADQGGWLKLRRPVHRIFHIAAWEAACRIPNAPWASPAVAPAKIASAGFVLRDASVSPQLTFQILRGTPQGWLPLSVPLSADPDASRQLRALNLVPRGAAPSPGYTGEEVFPLHTLQVTDGGTPHTLLYGYLPVGGAQYLPASAPAADPGSVPEELDWPFGLADQPGTAPPATYTADWQIQGGAIQPAMAAFLALLLGRHQFVAQPAWSDPANAAMIMTLSGIGFFADPPEAGQALPDLRQWAADNPVPGATLASWLQSLIAPDTPEGQSLQACVGGTTPAEILLGDLMAAAPGAAVTPSQAAFPGGAGNLLVGAAAAAALRAQLLALASSAAAASATDMPVPKLASGPAGRYVVVPFVRIVRPDGCEKIFWGAASNPFAVAAMFDPDASRPVMIEMPDLADAKRGLARGAAFKLPPSLADLVTGLSNGSAAKAALQGSPPGGGLGIGFICSFSLPAISICAMLMLSVTLSLLNIFLGWMAWVKICLPIPVAKSSGS